MHRVLCSFSALEIGIGRGPCHPRCPWSRQPPSIYMCLSLRLDHHQTCKPPNVSPHIPRRFPLPAPTLQSHPRVGRTDSEFTTLNNTHPRMEVNSISPAHYHSPDPSMSPTQSRNCTGPRHQRSLRSSRSRGAISNSPPTIALLLSLCQASPVRSGTRLPFPMVTTIPPLSTYYVPCRQ